jgi:hypothetical protein
VVKAGDDVLDVKPVEIGGRDSGFKEDGGATLTFFDKIEAAAAADIDPSTGAGIEAAVTMRAY